MSSPVHQPQAHFFVKCVIDTLHKDDFQLITVLMISIHIPAVSVALKWCLCSYNWMCLICSCHTVAHKHMLCMSLSVLDPVPVWCDVWHNVVFCLGDIYYWFCSRMYVLYIFPDMLPSHSVFDYPAGAENLEVAQINL